MDSETPFTALAPPVFKGENYQIWAARMEAYLEANDLWDAVKEDYEVPPLTDNPTMAQLKSHNFRKSRKSKAKATLFAAVSEEIFTRIMNQKSAFDIWNFLKTEYAGEEKLKGMQKLNLIREFEMQQMKESETIKEYTDKLLSIANKIRLLGSEFSDSKIVQKILVTVPERFDATISSMESSKDLSTITLAELNSALQAQEQRRLMRIEGSVEGALQAKLQINHGEKDKKKSSKKNSRDAASSSKGEKKRDFPPCKHCGKKGHPPFKCWKRPDVKCGKCNKLGHHERICKSNFQQKDDAQVVSEQEEEQMFVASCFTSKSSSSSYCWLLDSGCTNHMTGDEELFRELDRSQVSNVRIGNGDCIPVKGKGTVAIESCTGTKLISDVLYVPDIDQNLLSVGQLVEKGFKVIFENKLGIIKDTYDNDVIRIKMRGKSFLLDPMEEEQAAYTATTTNTETWHKRLGIDGKSFEPLLQVVIRYGLRNDTWGCFLFTHILTGVVTHGCMRSSAGSNTSGRSSLVSRQFIPSEGNTRLNFSNTGDILLTEVFFQVFPNALSCVDPEHTSSNAPSPWPLPMDGSSTFPPAEQSQAAVQGSHSDGDEEDQFDL
nr:Retrovirus-related Pol polyprotein from transposon TNT 1-94 [Ipomoea trifida]